MGKTFKDNPDKRKFRETEKKKKSGIDFGNKKNMVKSKKKFKYIEEDDYDT